MKLEVAADMTIGQSSDLWLNIVTLIVAHNVLLYAAPLRLTVLPNSH